MWLKWRQRLHLDPGMQKIYTIFHCESFLSNSQLHPFFFYLFHMLCKDFFHVFVLFFLLSISVVVYIQLLLMSSYVPVFVCFSLVPSLFFQSLFTVNLCQWFLSKHICVYLCLHICLYIWILCSLFLYLFDLSIYIVYGVLFSLIYFMYLIFLFLMCFIWYLKTFSFMWLQII